MHIPLVLSTVTDWGSLSQGSRVLLEPLSPKETSVSLAPSLSLLPFPPTPGNSYSANRLLSLAWPVLDIAYEWNPVWPFMTGSNMSITFSRLSVVVWTTTAFLFLPEEEFTV